MDPHVLTHIHVERLDDRYPKLKIYITELNLDSCKYLPVAQVTTHCMV